MDSLSNAYVTWQEHTVKNQKACHICQKVFCYDKNYENYTDKKGSKTTVITQENVEELLIANYKVSKDIPVIIHNAS